MEMQIPAELLLDVFGFLKSCELYTISSMVCRKWNTLIGRNSHVLSRKVLTGKFEIVDMNTIKYSRGSALSMKIPILEARLFWNPKFIFKSLHIQNFAYEFAAIQKIYETDNNFMQAENLVLQNGPTTAAYFLEDYGDLAKAIQPKHITCQHHRKLDVYVELARRRPFANMSLDELVDFIANADDNKKSQKNRIKINWNFQEALEFAQKLVQKFLATKNPRVFFKEIDTVFEPRGVLRHWQELFSVHGLCIQLYGMNSGRFNDPIVYEISRPDGWKIALDTKLLGSTKFYVYHASEVKSVSTSQVLDLAI